ncbi:hypothetical protein LPMP_355040 [Leishmania panamensis]|uniref:Calponin-homology (CH) domain-containing protein n=1 Tax=Leishmania panamensis TaxID=5679 RepID=A0A088S4S5_LEIPA|nr:hypothetical protein LPMP_355040 [Leishmania panamensis]AIO02635.1 hypothetical protein LPMP_355040 [Leishmania panamensis]
MSTQFSEQDKEDLTEIFRIYDPSKVDKVDDTLALSEKAGQTPAELFDDLYKLFGIQKLPQRDTVAKRLLAAVSNATADDIESAIRQSEMKGFTERDALRLLERKYDVQHVNTRVLSASRNSQSSAQHSTLEDESEVARASRSLRHINVNEFSMASRTRLEASGDVAEVAPEPSLVSDQPLSKLSAAPRREDLDEILAEEMREWLAKVVGEKYNADVLTMPNFIDALRSGILLHVLLQKMENPPIADEDLKLPKRTTGFFIRDNVATFLTEAKKRYELVDAQLFTASDLVDGKNDRQVVTCLMSMARIAYGAGTIKIAPNIIVYEHEIEQQQSRLTRIDLDRIVQEAEADEETPAIATRPNDTAECPSSNVAPASAITSLTMPSHDVSEHVAPSPIQASSGESESALMQDGLASTEVAVDGFMRCSTPQRTAVTANDEPRESSGEGTAAAASPSTPPLRKSPLSESLPPASERTLSTPIIEHAAESRAMSATTDVGEQSLSRNGPVGQPSRAIAQLTPTRSGEALAAAAQCTAAAPPAETTAEETEAQGTDVSGVAPLEKIGAGEEVIDGSDRVMYLRDGGGRVFYLRDGVLRPAKSSAMEEKVVAERRTKAGPRVVWKEPISPLATTRPPRYHSRHWDGIDVALGRHLNEHYEKHHRSPWRFRSIASTSGEYVLYNRLNGSRRVVFLRIIQRKLFLRNTGKHQPWIEIGDALGELEKLEA